jgi:hypothetical protein
MVKQYCGSIWQSGMTRRRWSAWAIVVFGLFAPNAIGAGIDFRLIAKTGDPSPLAGPNAKILNLGTLAADAAGDMAFVAGIDAPGVTDENRDMILVADSNGTSRMIARQGQSAAGAPANSTFGSFYYDDLRMNDAGNVAFVNQMTPAGGGPNAYVTIWSDVGGLHLADSAVTTASIFDSGDFTYVNVSKFDATGRIAYAKNSFQSSGQVITDGLHSFWLAPAQGPAHAVVTVGDQISLGGGPYWKFNYLYDSVSLESNGRVVYGAQLTGDGINTLNNDTIWADDNGFKQILMRDGQAAPGLPSGTIMTHVQTPYADSAGHLAFTSTIAGPDTNSTNSEAIFSTTGGSLHLVARLGQAAPGVGAPANFLSLPPTLIKVDGNATLFLATVRGAADRDIQATFVDRNGTLTAITYDGQPAPGMGVGYSVGYSPSLYQLPNADRFLVQAGVSFGGQVAGQGVWVEDQNYRLQPLLHVGSMVKIGDAFKEVHWVSPGSPTSSGQVPFSVTFMDNSEAILLWNGVLPTPGPTGDYNGDGMVDAADYTLWRDSLGTTGSSLAADGNNNLLIDPADYTIWRSNFGQKTVVSGDYDHNGTVDAADYTMWRDSLGQTGTGLVADGNHNNTVDAGDYTVWKSNFGAHTGSGAGASANAAVPEPASLRMLLAGTLTMCCWRRTMVS